MCVNCKIMRKDWRIDDDVWELWTEARAARTGMATQSGGFERTVVVQEMSGQIRGGEAMSAEPIYTYEVHDIIYGDWNGVVPEGAFRATGRPGWLVPVEIDYEAAEEYALSTMQDLDVGYSSWVKRIVDAALGITE